ncbi:MAG: hypothetical protein WAL67_16425 [Candidatus Cybelea sp.]
MGISGFSCYALTGCVAAAMLAGCSASQQPIGAPGAMPQTSALAWPHRASMRRPILSRPTWRPGTFN